MKDLQVWLTYHDDSMVEEYHLKEDDVITLFKGNDVNIKGDNINYLNKFYSELTTMYYVWKNNIRSKQIGFCHYRRRFFEYLDVEAGQCQVLSINYNSNIFLHYKSAHNYQDLFDAVDILNEKYGKDNKYSQYLLHGDIFIPFCCFIMNYEDFEKLAEWLFDILFKWDKKNNLDMNPENYMAKAHKDFRYEDVDYQCRAIAFLAERLISCYIVCEMKAFTIGILN